MVYTVKFYEGRYADRQRAANNDKAVLYVEQHFNASRNPSANYAMAIVATNASRKSREVATDYVNDTAAIVGDGTYWRTIRIGGAGNNNIINTKMPAVLLEPCFLTNGHGLNWASDDSGQQVLAEILVNVIKKHFPNGGHIAFSVGHEGNRPGDMGVVTSKGTEAGFARKVLKYAEAMLTRTEGAPTKQISQRKITVPITRDGKEVAHFHMFEGDTIEVHNNNSIAIVTKIN